MSWKSLLVACSVIVASAVYAHAQPSGDFFVFDATPSAGGGSKAPIELQDGSIIAVRTIVSAPGLAVVCYRSVDQGRTWAFLSEIARDDNPQTDIGDASFAQLQDGTLLCVYRHNLNYYFIPDLPESEHIYRIKVAASVDNGATWQPHSTVKEVTGTKMGLWSPSLLEKRNGTVQCYYDDEHIAEVNGLRGHQWAAMKTWDADTSQWTNPVVVSRAYNPAHLSRDGMCSTVELPSGRLICAFESVQVTSPFRALLRYTTSDDGGQTWSWQAEERNVLYQPENILYNANAPWLIRLSTGELVCVFITDEDRDTPGVPGDGAATLEMDVKCVISQDDGETWTEPMVVDVNYPLLWPGICELKNSVEPGVVLVQYVDFGASMYRAKQGRLMSSQPNPWEGPGVPAIGLLGMGLTFVGLLVASMKVLAQKQDKKRV